MMETKVEDADTNMPGSWPVGKDFASDSSKQNELCDGVVERRQAASNKSLIRLEDVKRDWNWCCKEGAARTASGIVIRHTFQAGRSLTYLEARLVSGYFFVCWLRMAAAEKALADMDPSVVHFNALSPRRLARLREPRQ
jgi:hypothetical protein